MCDFMCDVVCDEGHATQADKTLASNGGTWTASSFRASSFRASSFIEGGNGNSTRTGRLNLKIVSSTVTSRSLHEIACVGVIL